MPFARIGVPDQIVREPVAHRLAVDQNDLLAEDVLQASGALGDDLGQLIAHFGHAHAMAASDVHGEVLGLPVGGLGATLGRASGRILFSKPSPEAAGLA